MLTRQITKDRIYDTVDPQDFQAMIDVERYGQRTSAFDKIISATHDHFWDPVDTKYIDFDQPFDMENAYLVDPKLVAASRTAIWDELDEKRRIKLANLETWWSMSSVLHGEQGALALSASLCHILKDPGAQEYAANQAREEARHVTAFARYVKTRWGKPIQVGPALGNLLTEMVNSDLAWKKIVGMQLLVEGLAMGAFATFYQEARDPVIVKLCQLAMTDEAFHHKFGKIWADRTIPKLSEEERNAIEDWAAQVFQTLLFNLASPEQKKPIYAMVGLDWQRVQSAFLEALTDERLREDMQHSTNIFRVLIKTLVKAGIVTKRTALIYTAYVNVDELRHESDEMVGDAIAEQGIDFLKQINAAKAKTGSVLAAE
ncbi:MAG: ferritin-like domain-containing protein [Alphaproteobacteria bacterium]|nr:ferritin-like domain-containing protein [Alphaproteobacteria bacterium]